MDERTCPCGIELTKKPGPGRWPTYCSPECKAEARRAPRRLPASPRWVGTCPQCNGGVYRVTESGPAPIYCSPTCRSASYYTRRKGAISAKRATEQEAALAADVKACRQCGVEFTPRRTRRQVFCSRECNHAFHRDSAQATCSEPECGRSVRARGLCHMHYRATRRASGEEAAQAWTPERKARWLKRAAIKRGAGESGKFTAEEIYERDDWRCGLCSTDVDSRLTWPDPMSASIDHVIPLSKGGAHLPKNVQLAHLRCNLTKGAKVA